ncbi:MAG: hypothetical protein EOP85_11505 [Verrucomicrobiaceae bacterium]|nr:MAG: hypothetical protein EOP85_11505 [Verrucomicrobiaceae bacterium]
MKQHLPKLGVLLLLLAAGLVFFESDKPDLRGTSSTRNQSPVPSGAGHGREDTDGPAKRAPRPRRLTIEQILGGGSQVIRPSVPGDPVRVVFDDGGEIVAASAHAVENGVRFRGPYSFVVSGGATNMSSEEEDASLVVSKEQMKTVGRTVITGTGKDGVPSTVIADKGLVINLGKTGTK